jgi:hypothetical protein
MQPTMKYKIQIKAAITTTTGIICVYLWTWVRSLPMLDGSGVKAYTQFWFIIEK